MPKDIFSGLVKGLGAFMPKDDPNTKIFQAQAKVNDLEHREQELYVEIGKKVFVSIKDKPEYSEIMQELSILQNNLLLARLELQRAESEKTEKERQEEEEILSRTCSNCSTLNPEGVKFCQECGTKLGIKKNNCPQCGFEYQAGTRFCGECGTRL